MDEPINLPNQQLPGPFYHGSSLAGARSIVEGIRIDLNVAMVGGKGIQGFYVADTPLWALQWATLKNDDLMESLSEVALATAVNKVLREFRIVEILFTPRFHQYPNVRVQSVGAGEYVIRGLDNEINDCTIRRFLRLARFIQVVRDYVGQLS